MRRANFFADLKGDLDSIGELAAASLARRGPEWLHAARCGRVALGANERAAAACTPRRRTIQIPQDIFLAELDLERCAQHTAREGSAAL